MGGKDETEQFDDLGVSVVLCNSDKGKQYLSLLGLTMKEITEEQAVSHNGGFKESLEMPASRKRFFFLFSGGYGFYWSMKHCEKIALRTRVKQKWGAFITHLFKFNKM